MISGPVSGGARWGGKAAVRLVLRDAVLHPKKGRSFLALNAPPHPPNAEGASGGIYLSARKNVRF